MELSKEIAQARANLGLSQSQAAKVWEVPLKTLQGWEQGMHKPRGLALKHLRQILDTAMAAKPTKSETSPIAQAPKPLRPRKPRQPRSSRPPPTRQA